MGGLARRASYLQEQRARGRQLVHLDAGDLFFEDLTLPEDRRPQWLRKAEYIIDALDRMGLDAYTPGEKDLALGLEPLLQLRQRCRFPWVSANLRREQGGPLLLDSHVILEVPREGEARSWRVGIFGLTEPVLLALQETGLHGDGLVTAARHMVETLRDDVDYLICLCHATARGGAWLAEQVPELDLVCGVHGTDPPAGRKLDPTPRPAETSLQRGRGLGGRLIRVPQDPEHPGPLRIHGVPTSLHPRLPEDAAVVQLRQAYYQDLHRINLLPPPVPEVQLPYAGASSCLKCHPEQYELWQQTTHARAWETLEKLDRHLDLECAPCHSLELDSRARLSAPGARERLVGVQCEHCHGPGRAHREDPDQPMGSTTVASCTRCHRGEHDSHFSFDRDLLQVSCTRTPPPADPPGDR